MHRKATIRRDRLSFMFIGVGIRLRRLYALKGQGQEIFDFWFFSWISFPQAPEYGIQLRPFQIFSKIRGDNRSSRCTTGVLDTGCKGKKLPIIKVLIILFGHLWEVELTCKYIFAFNFTKVSAAWYCSHYLTPVAMPPVSTTLRQNCWQNFCRRCHCYRWQICHRCRWYQRCTLGCEYLRECSNKFETVLMGYSGAGGKLIHEKNQKQKISWHCPFKRILRAG